EVDHEVDRLVVGPDVGPAVDAGLDDGQVGGGALTHVGSPSWSGGGKEAGSGFLRTRRSRRRSTLGEASPAAMSRAMRRRWWPASAISAASSRSIVRPNGSSRRAARSN